jgi:hypothetical protein
MLGLAANDEMILKEVVSLLLQLQLNVMTVTSL